MVGYTKLYHKNVIFQDTSHIIYISTLTINCVEMLLLIVIYLLINMIIKEKNNKLVWCDIVWRSIIKNELWCVDVKYDVL